MTITTCDVCKTPASPQKYNNWIELRYGEGLLAKFGVRVHRLELCSGCFNDLTDALRKTNDD